MENATKKGRKVKTEKREFDNPFAVRLRELIKERGVTQTEVAEHISATRQALNKWCNGETYPDILIASEIADYFGVSLDYLVGKGNIRSSDDNMKVACKVTGLSEESINEITELKKIAMGGCSEYSYSCSSISVLNMLIKSPLFFNFMLLIADLNVSTQDYVQKVLLNDSKESIIEADKNFKVMLFEISKEFQKLIEDCYFPLYTSTEKVYRELYRSCHHGSDTEVEKASEEFGKLREIFLKMEDERLEQIK